MAGQSREPDLKQRPVLATYDEYEDAKAQVDRLSDARFPVEAVTIVGVNLRLVESILGRTSWGRAALGGMGMFGWLGILMGLFVSFFGGADVSTLEYMLLGLLYGAGFGIVFGLVSYAFQGRRHEFVSRQAIRAERYDLLCEADRMSQARQILGTGVAWPPPLPQAQPEPGDASSDPGESTSDSAPGGAGTP